MSLYGDAATEYWAAGWRGLLPLPARRKAPVPEGWTGHVDCDPSYADIIEWSETVAEDANIAIRLPADVIGIDVDDYAGKGGRRTLVGLLGQFGGLPETTMSTSRDDGTSGIRLFRVPPGLHWPGGLGPGIEIIQRTHRYLVVAPSTHPDTGQTYRWVDQTLSPVPWPRPGELPDLPQAWVEGITGGQLATEHARADLSDAETADWLTARTPATPPCRAVNAVLIDGILGLDTHASARHDQATKTTQAIAHLIAEGHSPGTALRDFRAAFSLALARDRGRGNDAEGEWRRMVTGAVRVAAAAHFGEPPENDPCSEPFAGIVDHVTAADASSAAQSPGAVRERVTGSVGSGDAARPSPEPPVGPTGGAAHALPGSESGPAVADIAAGPSSLEQHIALALEQETKFELRKQRARRLAKTQLDDEEATKAFRVPLFVETLADELELPDEDIHYRVNRVMPVNCNVTLAAGFKAGKTTLLNHLTRAIVDHELFLGEYLTHDIGRRVAIFNYEVDRGMYRNWLRAAGIVNTDQVVVLNLRGYSLPMHSSSYVLGWVVDWLAQRNVGTWVVDPFARAFTGGQENDNSEVGVFLDRLDQVKTMAGIRELVLPVHTGRAVAAEGQERARGATRLDDWTDVRWTLTVDVETGVRYFRATGRDVDEPERRLGYDATQRRPFIIGGTRRGDRAETYDFAIIEALEHEPGLSSNKLRQAVRKIAGSADNIFLSSRVEQLEQAGTIKVDRTGKLTRHFANDAPAAFAGIIGEPDVPEIALHEQGELDV